MYKDILDKIERIEMNDEGRKLVLYVNCLENLFSWNPFKIKNAEYYKRFKDWTKLREIQKIDNFQKINNSMKLRSYFYKKEIHSKKLSEKDLPLLIEKFTEDDLRIILTMKTLNSQVWHNRISALWANTLALIAIAISIFSALIRAYQ